MKKVLRHWKVPAKLAALLLILVLCVQFLGEVMFDHNFTERWRFLPNGSADVLFVGSSHVYASIIPQLLYDELGVAAVDATANEASTPAAYWVLEETLRSQNPSLVLFSPRFTLYDAALQHTVRDLPLTSPVRYEALYDIAFTQLGSYGEFENVQNMETLFKFLVSRQDFSTLSRANWRAAQGEGERTRNKGYYMLTGTEELPLSNYAYELNEWEIAMLDERFAINQAYLDKVVALSEKEGFELVFYLSPMYYNSADAYLWGRLYEYAAEKGIEILDCTDIEEIGLSAIDFSDAVHTRYTGAVKTTSYVADWLQANYSIADRRGQAGYEMWEETAYHYRADYAAWLVSNQRPGDLDQLAALLNQLDDKYAVMIVSPADPAASTSSPHVQLLQRLGLLEDGPEMLHVAYTALLVDGHVQEHYAPGKSELLANLDGISIRLSAAETSEVGPSVEVHGTTYTFGAGEVGFLLWDLVNDAPNALFSLGYE